MRFHADLHVHSKYSRATSRDCDLEHLDPALAALYRERFRHISVDEFQDVDAQRYRLLALLAPADGNPCGYLSRAQRRLWRGEVRALPPSPFLDDIEDELAKHQAAPALRRKIDNQLRLL
jgi:hypothetical protein